MGRCLCLTSTTSPPPRQSGCPGPPMCRLPRSLQMSFSSANQRSTDMAMSPPLWRLLDVDYLGPKRNERIAKLVDEAICLCLGGVQGRPFRHVGLDLLDGRSRGLGDHFGDVVLRRADAIQGFLKLL